MRARFEEFALQLHPDKTRLIEFGRHAAANRERRGLGKFRHQIVWLWAKNAPAEKSEERYPPWTRMKKLANDFLPKPKILHPWPGVRFAAKHPRWEPDALIGPVRICAGGEEPSSFLPR
jgi:RNA-directed DNA polymerase